MTIAVPGVPASRKTPGVAFNVILGGAGTSAGDAPISIMLLGNKSAAVSVSSPTYAQAAGTAAVDTVVSIASSDDAATMFGLGSELHIMSLAVFAQQPNAALFGCAVTEAGTAGTAVLTFVTSASAAGTVRLSLCGNIIDVPVVNGDSATTIAAAVCTYVNAVTSLPYYAQNSVGAVTFTAKNTGPRGNVLVVDAYFIASGAVVPTRITTSPTASRRRARGRAPARSEARSRFRSVRRRTRSPTRSSRSMRGSTTAWRARASTPRTLSA